MTESSDKPESPIETPETSEAPSSTPPHHPGFGGYPAPRYPYPPNSYPGGYYLRPPQPYPGFPPPPTGPKNGLGVASLVVAIIGLVLVWSVFGGVIFGIVAVVMGFVGYGRVKRREADNGGVAIGGIVLGVVAIIVGLTFIAIWVGVWKSLDADDFFDCLQKAGSDRASQQRCADQLSEHFQGKFNVTLTPLPPPSSP